MQTVRRRARIRIDRIGSRPSAARAQDSATRGSASARCHWGSLVGIHLTAAGIGENATGDGRTFIYRPEAPASSSQSAADTYENTGRIREIATRAHETATHLRESANSVCGTAAHIRKIPANTRENATHSRPTFTYRGTYALNRPTTTFAPSPSVP